MSPPDTSKINLPFYLNDYDEAQKFICFRVMCSLDYSNIISADFSHTEQQLVDQFDRISNDLQASYFFLKAANLILSSDTSIRSSSASVTNCAQLYETYHKKSFDSQNFVLRSNLNNYIPIDVLRKATIDAGKNEIYSPLFTNHKGVCRLQNFTIPIDCLVLADPKTKISSLHEIVIEKLILHVQAIKQCYLSYYQNENDFVAQTYHFLIDNPKSASSNLIITCIYPSTQTDENLIGLRSEIHRALDMSADRPVVQRKHALQFTAAAQEPGEETTRDWKSKYPVNPHLSAEPSNVRNGRQSLVKGDYVYFHYMHDGFNDNGWGCAYRSFQTIFSWFKLQSYTNKPVPSHRDIQQTLVRLGDKPASFVGSSKWIGSMEISFCLSDMIGVESRIISVSKGSELAEKARELQYHFETEGTPVMIGGGVLAHTIIGVDFDELTGDVKYLILDPHYTGADELKTITTKGWVAWKEVKFWNENSFYNLCCPIRPKGV